MKNKMKEELKEVLKEIEEKFGLNVGEISLYALLKLSEQKSKSNKLTDKEIKLLKTIPRECKWIARDEDGKIFSYVEKPIKLYNVKWGSYWGYNVLKTEGREFITDDFKFNFIKCEDEEPYNIDELIEKGEYYEC